MLFVRADRDFEDSMQAADCITRGRCRAVLAAVCFSLATSAGYGQSQPSTAPYAPITMQQAVDLARAKNPTLLAAQQNLLSVKAQEIQAGVRANPYFTASGGNLTETDSNVNPYNFTLGVGRLFERGQKRRWRLDVA